MIGEMHSYLPIFFQDLVGKKKKKSPKLILGKKNLEKFVEVQNSWMLKKFWLHVTSGAA